MTIDDRGRRAAADLQRSVAAQVDPDAALARLHAHPKAGASARSMQLHRMAVAVAAVLVLVTAGTIAALAQQDGDQRTDAKRTRELEDQLPASAIDGKATMRLPVLVRPQAGVRDGQTVTVAGRGFEPGDLVGVVLCGSEADTGAAGIDACQLGEGFSKVLGRANANTEGVASAEVKVSRFIDTESRGRIDCMEVAERCLVAMASASNYDMSGGAYLLFAGSPPFPQPRFTVSPTRGLGGGQRVVAVATGLIAGRGYQFQQCLGERCVLRQPVTASLEGAALGSLAVYPTIHAGGDDLACNGRCTIRLDGWGADGGTSAPFPADVPIAFDPDAPDVAEPPATTTTTSSTTITSTSTTTTAPASPGGSSVTTAPGRAPTTTGATTTTVP